MRPSLVLFAPLLLLSLAASATAQVGGDEGDAAWLDSCRNNWGGGDRGHACEVRAVPVRLTGRSIAIDGARNGSIQVRGWDGDSVKVTARVQAQARTDEEARSLLSSVKVVADGRGVRAEGPSGEDWDRAGWSSSYVVYVPRHFDLTLDAHNGSLRVAEVQGRMQLRTQNGSVALSEVGGEVQARTQNGSLNVQLAGTHWDGAGLDAETRNGSVRLSVPEHYAAQLETGTVNGRISTDLPLTVRGTIGRLLSTPLNGGGATVKALTTNGSVTILAR